MLRHRFAGMLLLAVLAIPLSACENTGEGIEADVEENAEEVDAEVGD